MVDHLTGWPKAEAIPDKEATIVARAVYEKLILQHGSPEILLSDNGYYYVHSYIALNEFYTIIWYAYLLKCFTMKFY